MRKTKKFAAILLLALILSSSFSVLPVSAATFGNDTAVVSSDESLISGDYEYSVLADGTVEITRYFGSDTNVIVPEKINNKKVTSIGGTSFQHNTIIKNVVLPKFITKIEYYSFLGCTNLKNINIPQGVTYISGSAFLNTGLESIIIPDTVTDMGNAVFCDCKYLKNVQISDYITYIPPQLFYNCLSLKSITIPKNVTKIDYLAFGYYKDTNETLKIEDFKIYGYKNTAAETYAKENGFEFISLGEQILIGDANQDGTVNIKDVTYLQMHIAGNKNTDGSPLIDETNKQLFDSIDMNNDGKLTVNDVTALQTYLAQNN